MGVERICRDLSVVDKCMGVLGGIGVVYGVKLWGFRKNACRVTEIVVNL